MLNFRHYLVQQLHNAIKVKGVDPSQSASTLNQRTRFSSRGNERLYVLRCSVHEMTRSKSDKALSPFLESEIISSVTYGIRILLRSKVQKEVAEPVQDVIL